MKKRLAKASALLTAMIMVFALAACGGNGGDTASEDGETMTKIKEEGKIIMGVNATYAPFEFHKTIDGKDEIVGFDIELGKAIAEELGVELEVVDMSFDGLLPALSTGKVDFLPGLSWSKERAENAAFTDPYHKSIQVVLTTDKNMDKIKADSDLAGMTIGYLKGSAQAKTFPSRYPKAETYVLGKIPDLIAALQSGRVDGVCLDYVVSKLYAQENEDLEMSAVQYELSDEEDAGSCVLVRKDDNEDLVAVINKVLKRVIENGDLEKWEEDAIKLMDLDDIQ